MKHRMNNCGGVDWRNLRTYDCLDVQLGVLYIQFPITKVRFRYVTVAIGDAMFIK